MLCQQVRSCHTSGDCARATRMYWCINHSEVCSALPMQGLQSLVLGDTGVCEQREPTVQCFSVLALLLAPCGLPPAAVGQPRGARCQPCRDRAERGAEGVQNSPEQCCACIGVCGAWAVHMCTVHVCIKCMCVYVTPMLCMYGTELEMHADPCTHGSSCSVPAVCVSLPAAPGCNGPKHHPSHHPHPKQHSMQPSHFLERAACWGGGVAPMPA